MSTASRSTARRSTICTFAEPTRGHQMRVVMVGPFGLRRKGTMNARALPVARAVAARGHAVTVLIPPWDSPSEAGRTWEEYGVRVVNVCRHRR
jgi:hypothetical protein